SGMARGQECKGAWGGAGGGQLAGAGLPPRGAGAIRGRRSQVPGIPPGQARPAERGRTMKKGAKGKRDPDLLDEYDFSKGVRGKYAKRYTEGTNVVVLAPDVAAVFPDAESVNDALRALVQIIRRNSSKANP